MKGIFLEGKNDYYFFDPGYKNHKVISSGKFSTIFKGVRKSDNVNVAIKQLNPQLSENKYIVHKFQKESSFNFSSPNIIKVFEYIIDGSNHYLVSEFINGLNLKQILKNRKYKKKATEKFFIRCIIGVLDALEEIHKSGVYHRDIKPSNIMVEFVSHDDINFDFPKVRLIDFGQSRAQKGDSFNLEPFSLIYSPPEQVLKIDNLINATSDIYCTGITLYELLTGQPPFFDSNPLKLITLQVAAIIPEDKKIKPELFTILLKATAKYPLPKPPHHYKYNDLVGLLKKGQDSRFQSSNELREELVKYLDKF